MKRNDSLNHLNPERMMTNSDALTWVIEYLERHKGEWIAQDRIEYLMAQNDVRDYGVFKRLKNVPYIGARWDSGIRKQVYTWYESKPIDVLTATALETYE